MLIEEGGVADTSSAGAAEPHENSREIVELADHEVLNNSSQRRRAISHNAPDQQL